MNFRLCGLIDRRRLFTMVAAVLSIIAWLITGVVAYETWLRVDNRRVVALYKDQAQKRSPWIAAFSGSHTTLWTEVGPEYGIYRPNASLASSRLGDVSPCISTQMGFGTQPEEPLRRMVYIEGAHKLTFHSGSATKVVDFRRKFTDFPKSIL